jgi:B12-binding domain/radical SAM domain protein
MSQADLILLHPPSVYDFRKKAILYGPVSDVVPSTQAFEMYPIGFLTILDYLQRHGHSVRIINVANRMLRNRRFDVEKLVRSLRPVAFGIDLHWLVHAQGSLELAKVIKKHHPQTPVIFGGLSASYYHEELIDYPQVDYVIRGDSAEEPLRQLLSAIKRKHSPGDVPNLTWKQNELVHVNRFSHVPPDLTEVSFDYRKVMRSTARYRDLLGHLPFKDWFSYPIVAALSCRGCMHDCITCGGSASAYKKICDRQSPAFRSPEQLSHDIALASRHIKAPVIILGDLLQAGEEHTRQLLRGIRAADISNPIALEFFSPPPRDMLEMVASAIPNFNIQISPESHDGGIRRRFGRAYDNLSLERAIQDALELGCKRVDVFFMIGLPGQTPQSARDTVKYCEVLVERCAGGQPGRIHPYISPLAPFLDPGSRAFEDPQEYGYRLFFRTLEEHRGALLAPSWKHTLNYETRWMSRDEIAGTTYETALELNRLKARYGLVSQRTADQIQSRIEAERHVMHEIDNICATEERKAWERNIERLMHQFDCVGPSTICDEDEMKWPTTFLRFAPLRVIRGALFSKG